MSQTTINNSNSSKNSSTALALLTVLCALVACTPAYAQSRPHTGARFEKPERGYPRVEIPKVALPSPGDSGPVSLDGILAYADEHAPTLLVARQRLGLGEAKTAAAKPLLPANPTLFLGAGPRFAGGGTAADFRAQLYQRVEIAGERGLRLDAAKRTSERLNAELDAERWQVHRDVHAAFHLALLARERLAATERLLLFQGRLLEISQGRLRAGDVSPLAVRLAKGELSQARVAKLAAEQAYLSARLKLGALTGWPPNSPPEPAGHLDPPRDPPSGDALRQAARRYQPRVRTLDASLAEAEADRQVAEREAWVEPTFGVRFSREGAPLGGTAQTIVVGTLSVPVPLVQFNQGPRAEALARVNIKDAERAAFASQLESSIELHRTAVLSAAARVRTYGGEILPTFEENLRLIQRAFELGEIDILQVSVARERFLKIQTDALDAYSSYFQAIADLEGTIGTDLWPEEHHEHRDSQAGDVP